MPDPLTPQQRHDCMASIHSQDTRPEQTVRKELWHRGYRFRICVRSLPGTPDVVLPKYRTAIFVNGCFWHGHRGCPKYVLPRTNVLFWQTKIARNQERDLLNIQRLESIGWNVITVWECELAKSRLPQTIERLETQLHANEDKWEALKARRRADRQFALSQARKRREIAALVASELSSEFASDLPVPARIRRLSKSESEEE